MTLVCDKCGHVAEGPQLLIARPGGTHYIDHAGFRGRNSEFFRRATRCGKWVERP
jgi:hypothetical protein